MVFHHLQKYIASQRMHPGEKKLVRKLDFFILSFCCLMYCANGLNRSNLANAYVSGMKEDLEFVGNQFNQIHTVFTLGFVVGQVPSTLAVYYFKPRIFFPGMMVIWGGLSMVMVGVKHPRDIMIIRFVQGITESSTFAGTHYILGSWYTPCEIGKRSGIFTSSGLAGLMFGGYLQTAIHSSLDGVQGLTGWRWLFIVDGLITIPIAIYGLFLFPDTPATTTAFYLSKTERILAISRLPEVSTRTPWNVAFLKRVVTSWYLYGFVMLWVIAGETESFSTNALLALWMKSSKKYSISQLNTWPTGVPAIGIVSTLFWATLTDLLGGKRYLVGFWIAVTGITTASMILTAGGSEIQIFAAYFWAGSMYACQATFFAWANDAMRWEEHALRAVVIACMNCAGNAVNAWWSLVLYSANMAPSFTRGMWAMIAICIAMAFWTAGLIFMTSRDKKRRMNEEALRTSSDLE